MIISPVLRLIEMPLYLALSNFWVFVSYSVHNAPIQAEYRLQENLSLRL